MYRKMQMFTSMYYTCVCVSKVYHDNGHFLLYSSVHYLLNSVPPVLILSQVYIFGRGIHFIDQNESAKEKKIHCQGWQVEVLRACMHVPDKFLPDNTSTI